MLNKSEGKLILALETGIDGGSVAIIEEKKVLCFSKGTGSVSKSEDLLLLVDDLLEKNNLKKESIGLIAVSDSPGSSTGIRIGLATAAGLGDSLSAKIFKCSILDAQLINYPAENVAISALYSDKNGIYYRKFRANEGSRVAETEILNEREPGVFMEMLSSENCLKVLDKNLATKLSSGQDSESMLQLNDGRIVEGSLAERIGLTAYISNASDNE